VLSYEREALKSRAQKSEGEAKGRAGADALRVFLKIRSNFRIRSAQVARFLRIKLQYYRGKVLSSRNFWNFV